MCTWPPGKPYRRKSRDRSEPGWRAAQETLPWVGSNTTLPPNAAAEVEAVLEELSECVPAPGSVGERLDADELARAVDSFVLEQDARTRRVFVQRCFDCDTVPDIARQNGMTEQAVRSLLHRTRRKLRAYLESEELI